MGNGWMNGDCQRKRKSERFIFKWSVRMQTECATFSDNYSLPKIHEQLSQTELVPDKHLVDAGYIEASNL
jgi:hypothetical protein